MRLSDLLRTLRGMLACPSDHSDEALMGAATFIVALSDDPEEIKEASELNQFLLRRNPT